MVFAVPTLFLPVVPPQQSADLRITFILAPPQHSPLYQQEQTTFSLKHTTKRDKDRRADSFAFGVTYVYIFLTPLLSVNYHLYIF